MTKNPSDILRSRKYLGEGHAYPLSGSDYGMDVAFGPELALDEGEMSVWVPFADGNRRDGVGDKLEVAGINTERHRANPVVLFDHGKQYVLPVGLAERDGQYLVEIDPAARTARGKAYFYQGTKAQGDKLQVTGGEGDHALFCEQLFHLMAQKFIRAGSIGYQVIHAKHLGPDHESGTPAGLHLLSVLMLEFSVVVMPANMDTVRKALAMPRVCGKSLHPGLAKSLQAHAGPRKAQLGYEGRHKDLLPGGLADKIPPSRFDPLQVARGRQVEMEHTSDPELAAEIARDHLSEDPDYYRKLAKIEKSNDKGIPTLGGGEADARRRGIEAGKQGKPMSSNPYSDPGYSREWKAGYAEGRAGTATKPKMLQNSVVRPGDRVTHGTFGPGVVVKAQHGFIAVKFQDGKTKVVWVEALTDKDGKKFLKRTKGLKGINPAAVRKVGDELKNHRNPAPMPGYGQIFVKGDEAWYVGGDGDEDGFSELVEQKLKGAGFSKVTVEAEVFPPKGGGWVQAYPAGDKAAPKVANVTGFGPGERVIARTYLSWINPVSGRTENFAKTGDRMTVLEVEPSGRVRVARPDGATAYFSSAEIRRGKSMGIKSIRVTYRNKVVKGFAEVQVKFDTSHMGVDEQNNFCKDMNASGFGNPAQGRFNEKGRLTAPMKAATFTFDIDPGVQAKGAEGGDDAVADAVKAAGAIARKHGARFMGNMGKRLTGSKALDENDDLPGEDDIEISEDDGSEGDKDLDAAGVDEPYGAQIIRHMHEDLSQRLKDYHEMLGPLENQPVKKHAEGYLAEMDKWLGKKEDLFGKEYGHLPALTKAEEIEPEDGAEAEAVTDSVEEGDTRAKDADTMDDAAVSAGSGGGPDGDLPDPDEAAEAMSVKSLRRFYRNKAKGICPCRNANACTCDKGAKGRKDLTEDEARQIQGEVEQVGEDLADETADTEEKALEEYELGHMGEAKGFAEELAQPGSQLDEEGRMKAYHFHKTLDGIANVKAMADGAEAQDPSGGAGDPNSPPGLPMEKRFKDIYGEEYGDIPPGNSPAAQARLDLQRIRGSAYDAAEIRAELDNHISRARRKAGTSGPNVRRWCEEYVRELERAKAGVKSMGMDAPAVGGPATGGYEGKMTARKMCGKASSFFKAMSSTKDFGDPHRADAAEIAKGLGEHLGGDGPPPDAAPPGAAPESFSPGEMGEKALMQTIAEQSRKQREAIAALQRQLGKLLKV